PLVTGVQTCALPICFESASTELLRENHKPNLAPGIFADRIASLGKRGMRVILNVLGGLPGETREAHEQTLAFIYKARSDAWLYRSEERRVGKECSAE